MSVASSKITAAKSQDVLSHPYSIRNSFAHETVHLMHCRNQGPDFLIDGLFLKQKGAGEASLGGYISKDKSDMDSNKGLGDSIITGEFMPRHK